MRLWDIEYVLLILVSSVKKNIVDWSAEIIENCFNTNNIENIYDVILISMQIIY